MKKNVMMRVASIMLVLVLLTSSVISGTFAKYVTSDSASDSARVAKWGVKVEAEGVTFANAYATDDKTLSAEAQSRIGVNSVVSSDANVDVVAPGTRGDMAAIKITGKPEVAVDVSYVGVFDIEGWFDDNGNYYCPLIITINGTAFNGLDYANPEQFEWAVNNAIDTYHQYYAANTKLEDYAGENLDISWEWPFSTSAENDVKDTDLGDKAANENAATVQLTVTATVTQVD